MKRRKTDWQERYKTGILPRDMGRLDFNLEEIVAKNLTNNYFFTKICDILTHIIN
ncbi:MAG: hypothetical protein ABID09_04180 [Candidatus Omnitrophota bacterium]